MIAHAAQGFTVAQWVQQVASKLACPVSVDNDHTPRLVEAPRLLFT
jgi:hypothetical protein